MYCQVSLNLLRLKDLIIQNGCHQTFIDSKQKTRDVAIAFFSMLSIISIACYFYFQKKRCVVIKELKNKAPPTSHFSDNKLIKTNHSLLEKLMALLKEHGGSEVMLMDLSELKKIDPKMEKLKPSYIQLFSKMSSFYYELCSNDCIPLEIPFFILIVALDLQFKENGALKDDFDMTDFNQYRKGDRFNNLFKTLRSSTKESVANWVSRSTNKEKEQLVANLLFLARICFDLNRNSQLDNVSFTTLELKIKEITSEIICLMD